MNHWHREGWPWARRTALTTLALGLAAVLLTGSSFAASGSARSAYRIKIKPPGQVIAGARFSFRVRGHAARRSILAVLLDHRRCARSAQVESRTHHFAEKDISVRGRFGPFKLSATAATTGGRQYICGYLLKGTKAPLKTRARARASYLVRAPVWSIKRGVDTVNGLKNISCLPSLCVAYDRGGGVVTSSDPASGPAAQWAYSDIDPGGTLNGLSCPSTSLCVAVDTSGNVLTTSAPTQGASTVWSTHHVTGFLYGVTCPSTSLCLSTDGRGAVLTSTDPAAGASATWKSKQVEGNSVGGLQAISCGSTSLCVAVDGAGRTLTTTNPSRGQFATWNTKTIDPAREYGGSPVDISCTASLCTMIDSVGTVFTSTNPGLGASASWRSENVNRDNPLAHVSCASTQLCVATDGSGGVVTSSDPGSSTARWLFSEIDPYSLTLGEAGIDGISCPSTSLCVAVDDHGSVLTSTHPGG